MISNNYYIIKHHKNKKSVNNKSIITLTMIHKEAFIQCIACHDFRAKSHAAEQEHLKHVFLCQNGGGEKSIARHVDLNKKVLVRDRLRRILDEDAEFFELSTTAGDFVRLVKILKKTISYLPQQPKVVIVAKLLLL